MISHSWFTSQKRKKFKPHSPTSFIRLGICTLTRNLHADAYTLVHLPTSINRWFWFLKSSEQEDLYNGSYNSHEVRFPKTFYQKVSNHTTRVKSFLLTFIENNGAMTRTGGGFICAFLLILGRDSAMQNLFDVVYVNSSDAVTFRRLTPHFWFWEGLPSL